MIKEQTAKTSETKKNLLVNFQSQLSDPSKNGFQVVADYFSRGILTKVT